MRLGLRMQSVTPTRCAIYTRVSIEEQAREGYSLAAQEERMRSHANSQGWAVYKFYCDDGYSAASRRRPALKRLLAEATLAASTWYSMCRAELICC